MSAFSLLRPRMEAELSSPDVRAEEQVFSAKALRTQIETELSARIPAALSPSPARIYEKESTGVPEIDLALGAGIPVGAVSEIVGGECCGRTSLALSAIAQITRSGRAAAWIDASDTLSPESAAASGVVLPNLLWVRCSDHLTPRHIPAAHSQSQTEALQPKVVTRIQHGHGGSHPRDEARGMDAAVSSFLQYDAQRLHPASLRTKEWGRVKREEQVSSDRRGNRNSYVVEHSETACVCCLRKGDDKTQKQYVPSQQKSKTQFAWFPWRNQRPWKRLDKALRATDLLLQGGGFRAIVLDLGGIAPEHAARIPMATWFRFRSAAQNTGAVFLLLTQHPCALSSASLVLRMEARAETRGRLLTGVALHTEIARQRFTEQAGGRKPVASAEWKAAHEAVRHSG